MTAQPLGPRIVILDGDPCLVTILQATFELAGYRTSTPEAAKQEWVPDELAQFLRHENAQAVVYDVTFPYKTHYERFQEMRQYLGDRQPAFVLTCTSKHAVEHLAGSRDGAERISIVEKPFQLDDVLRAVDDVLAEP